MTILDTFSNEEVTTLDMLDAFMMFRIVGEVNGSLVVASELDGLICVLEPQLGEHAVQRYGLLVLLAPTARPPVKREWTAKSARVAVRAEIEDHMLAFGQCDTHISLIQWNQFLCISYGNVAREPMKGVILGYCTCKGIGEIHVHESIAIGKDKVPVSVRSV